MTTCQSVVDWHTNDFLYSDDDPEAESRQTISFKAHWYVTRHVFTNIYILLSNDLLIVEKNFFAINDSII